MDAIETKVSEEILVKIRRCCVHCLFEWEAEATRKELLKIVRHEAIGFCQNPRCGMPT